MLAGASGNDGQTDSEIGPRGALLGPASCSSLSARPQAFGLAPCDSRPLLALFVTIRHRTCLQGECKMDRKPLIGLNADYRSARKDAPAFSYPLCRILRLADQGRGHSRWSFRRWPTKAIWHAVLDVLDGVVMVGGAATWIPAATASCSIPRSACWTPAARSSTAC